MNLSWMAAGGALICLSAAGLGLALGHEGREPARLVPQPQTLVGATERLLPLEPADGDGFLIPIACTVGEECQIQNYTDRDDGPGSQDYRCGVRTYDAHNGTDFRLRDMAAQGRGVAVLAAAAGVVSRVRDGVPDISVVHRGRESVAGQECGNGLVLAHSGGLTSQYCHMESGSIVVRAGDFVEAGQTLGAVGLSGLTEYPHLHFTVRRGDAVIDPFSPETSQGSAAECPSSPSMWADEAARRLIYRPRVVLNFGSSSGPVTMEAVERGGVLAATAAGDALVFYVRALGLQRGDIQTLAVTGPTGEVLARNVSDPLTSNRAQQLIFAGRRSRGGPWPSGIYSVAYGVQAGDIQVLAHRFTLEL